MLAPSVAKAMSLDLSPAPSYILASLTHSAFYLRYTRYFTAIEGKLLSGLYTHLHCKDMSFSSQQGEGDSPADRCLCIRQPVSNMQERYSVPGTPPVSTPALVFLVDTVLPETSPVQRCGFSGVTCKISVP